MAGVCLQDNRDPLEAKVLALKAVDMEPSAANYSMLAMACRNSGDPAGARSAMSRAAALDPGETDPVLRQP